VFTGIVEQMGSVVETREQATGRRLAISANLILPIPQGASIAVNGVCLTSVDDEGALLVDVVPETLSRTNLGDVQPGDYVNLERAMPANGRFDGHIVQGHVDGTGVIGDVTKDAEGVVVSVETDDDILQYVVEKGSITVDGVSLTVAGLRPDGFQIALIPHTIEVTTLGLRKPGDVVNLEVDVLAKYVERLLKVER
jgi:riboflavin synthase